MVMPPWLSYDRSLLSHAIYSLADTRFPTMWLLKNILHVQLSFTILDFFQVDISTGEHLLEQQVCIPVDILTTSHDRAMG